MTGVQTCALPILKEMDKIGFEKILPCLISKSYKINQIHNMNKPTKLLCFELKRSKIAISDIIIKKLDDKFSYCRIESIEVEHKKYNQFESNNATDVGIMLDRTRKPNEEYWIYHTISD